MSDWPGKQTPFLSVLSEAINHGYFILSSLQVTVFGLFAAFMDPAALGVMVVLLSLKVSC